ncbi:MAG TPA: DUF3006 domain-containing protein, partial [Tissierellaceae bacterium]|nr:DUF3006 domain-containing protein [Tissierellaceae bacterium]
FAVCERENKEMIDIERDKLPKDAKEGDILIIEGKQIKVDKAATEKRRKEIKKLMDSLWED